MTFKPTKYRPEIRILADILKVIQSEGEANKPFLQEVKQVLGETESCRGPLRGDEYKSRYYILTLEGKGSWRKGSPEPSCPSCDETVAPNP
ncbi:MAG: hypothetical protein QXV77_00075 [Candidatus Bathyarchaeia archaeon]